MWRLGRHVGALVFLSPFSHHQPPSLTYFPNYPIPLPRIPPQSIDTKIYPLLVYDEMRLESVVAWGVHSMVGNRAWTWVTIILANSFPSPPPLMYTSVIDMEEQVWENCVHGESLCGFRVVEEEWFIVCCHLKNKNKIQRKMRRLCSNFHASLEYRFFFGSIWS